MTNRVPCEPLVEALAILIHRNRPPNDVHRLKGIAHLYQPDQRGLHEQARRLLADAANYGVRIELTGISG